MEIITGQFNDSYKPVLDGVSNVVNNYAYWLNKKYGKSYIVTLDYPNYIDDEEFEVLRYYSIYLPRRAPYRIGIPQLDLKFQNRINDISFDLVHAHSPFSSGQLALKIARHKNIPIIATFHSKYYDDIKHVVISEHVAQMVLKKVIDFYNKVDVVWSVNKATIDTLRSYGYKGDVEVVYNGTDLKPVMQTQDMIEMVEKKLHISKGIPVLLFVGQHIWQKNLKTLVQSLSLLKKSGVLFKMIFVGTGEAKEALIKLSDDLMLSNDIVFLGSIKNREFLQSIYARSDLFVFPSIYDTSGIVTKEAAAAGCPSIVIENSNSAEGIIDNYNGYTVQNDPERISKRIYEILSNAEELKKAGINAQNTLFQSWESIIENVSKRYLEIIKNFKKT